LIYELGNIESRVSDIISLVKEGNDSDTNKIKEAILNECQRIRLAFKQEAIAAEEERILKKYFSFHQQGITELINCCSRIRTNSAKAGLLLSDMVRVLSQLLHFVKDHFGSYCDLNGSIPEVEANLIRLELATFADEILNKFGTSDLDPSLLNVVLTAIKHKESAPVLSFAFVQNLHGLRKVLLMLDCSIDADLLRQDFCKTLIHYNFNAAEFYEYYLLLINKSLSKCETLSDRIDQLAYFYKICIQTRCELHLPFNNDARSIQTQLLEWIAQELDYLKQKLQLQTTPSSKGEGLINDFKLNFDLSVSHLAYLFKSFTETGVIQNKNTSELIRFLTKFVRTKKSEAVSYESFRIKYYNAESGTKDAVKKTLQMLINYMNKN
jgi:hypothetical protein